MNVKKSLALAILVSGNAASQAPAMAADWSGALVGITGGGGWGEQGQHGGVLMLPGSSSSGTTTTSSITTSTSSSTCIFTGTCALDGRYRTSGGLVGGSVGYNWQQERFVYGVIGDGSWAHISGSGTCGLGSPTPHACGGGIDALGTVRARFGYDLGLAGGPFDGVLLFASGGLAVGEVKAWDSLFGTSGRSTLAGWTIGGGIEAMIAPHLSLGVEYLHVDFGEHGIFSASPPTPERVATKAEIVRVSLTYHFNWTAPAAPLVAKY